MRILKIPDKTDPDSDILYFSIHSSAHFRNTAADIQNRVVIIDQRITSSLSTGNQQQPPIVGSMASGEATQNRESMDNLRLKIDVMVAEQRKMVILMLINLVSNYI